MAKREGLNGMTVSMIVFAALWLGSTVFLIILYTGQDALVQENAKLQAHTDRCISAAEERSIAQAKLAQENGPTIVGIIEGDRAQTAQLASGEPTDNVAAVKAKHDQLLGGIKGDGFVPQADGFEDFSYHEALNRVYDAFKAERELRKTAEGAANDLKMQVASMLESQEKLKADFEKQTKDATSQLAQAESDRAAYRAERDKSVEKIERDFDDRRKQNDIDLTNERNQRQALGTRVNDLQKRIATQNNRLGGLLPGPEKLATARQADGKILTAVPGDDVVYINLGQKDGLVLGLQFAVYSVATGIPEDGKGKAVIEVVSTAGTSAECRVVSVAPNSVVLQGDLIANPIYDPSRPMTYVVIGDFDLNRDGAMDREGAAALEALITNWGGKVEHELTAMTDFVVVGAAPKRPRPTKEGDASARPDPNDPVQKAWDQYNQTVDKAKTLSIPIMTQEVFLNFLGYSGRVARK
ncbi:MAG: hypothetical protein HY287_05480 [Planctomycetes bacterium]|nr:hypothetical protein [Planctomycetota bacterium]MBI3833762.1 hypothetical protein [Planctomycetota bacterium]